MYKRLLASFEQQLWCHGIRRPRIYFQCTPEMLSNQTVELGQGVLDENGTLVIHTGKFTGRAPKDKYFVKDDFTEELVHWNEFNQPIEPVDSEKIRRRMMAYLSTKELWVRDAFVCADPQFSIPLRVVSEKPWASLFANNMFIAPKGRELQDFEPEWNIFHAPDFVADPASEHTRSPHFVIIDFALRLILIGGTAYTGEIKKGMFTVLNYLLPQKKVLPMHCSANLGKAGDVALFFGLSGTGKTTLSADPARRLIGDDEHGWSPKTVFNFEGGCYAKCIDLSPEKEPDIFKAIRPGALLENVAFFPGTNRVNYADGSITENTRVSYPLSFIEGALHPAIAGIPENIFFLTCDATGVLPPISKLTPEQAMYHFQAGYTAKIAGTEAGVTEPKSTFSPCFGAPFLPLHPETYARMLGEKISAYEVNTWLVNTGWSGGPYGVGSRIQLSITRSLIHAALSGQMEKTVYTTEPVFGLQVPTSCPGVPDIILQPRNTWQDPKAYDEAAYKLKSLFEAHMKKVQQAPAPARRGVFRTHSSRVV